VGKPAPEKQNHSGATNVDLLEQETVTGSGISWADANLHLTSNRSCQHHTTQFFYRPDALPAI